MNLNVFSIHKLGFEWTTSRPKVKSEQKTDEKKLGTMLHLINQVCFTILQSPEKLKEADGSVQQAHSGVSGESDEYGTASDDEETDESDSEGSDEEGEETGSEDFDGPVERQSGDGQEQESDVKKKVDDDEDRSNPQYIPKKGTFYEHDDRTAEDA